MKFRNMTFYRFPPATCAAALAAIETSLADNTFREPGPAELGTSGFVSPLTYDAKEALSLKNSDVSIIALATEKKIIPASAIAAAVKNKTDEILVLEQRRVSGRERKRIKAEAVGNLMQRALSRRSVVLGIIDRAQGWVVVGTSTRRVADEFIGSIRNAIGRFPATLIVPDESPRALMTNWVINEAMPDAWAVGDECVLRDPSEGGSRWVGRRIDIESDEVKEHLRAGMQVFSLGVELDSRCSFVLDESLRIRKFALADSILDAFADQQRGDETAQEEIAAKLALESLEILRVLSHIDNTFVTPMPDERN